MYAAGVLPIAWIADAMYVLVGKDLNETWSDFAGKSEKSDKDVQTTAAREFWEETYGVLMDAKTMRSRLVPDISVVLVGRTQNLHPYYCFVTEVPFIGHLRDAFRKHLGFLRQRRMYMHIEKTDVVYVSLPELFSDTFPKRSVFKETLASNKDLLLAIAAAGPAGFKHFCVRAAHLKSPAWICKT